MWPSQEYLDLERDHPNEQGGRIESRLSPQYRSEFAGKRLPMVVFMPGGRYLCIDSRFTNRDGYYGDGWRVTGDPPRVTLRPSVNLVGDYHGYITDGVISDDHDGRKYESE